MKKLLSITILFMIIFTGGMSIQAASHTVVAGDTYWKISKQYYVSVNELMSTNHAKNDYLRIGQKLILPNNNLSTTEIDLLSRLVEAEAKGEPFAGKVAVATVILNRVDHHLFPNTITAVINQPGQFTPVSNGTIKNPASSSTKSAVAEALAFRGKGAGSLYFYNPKKTNNTWLRSKQVTTTIGQHVFAK